MLNTHRYAALFALISTALCAQSVLDQGIAAFRSGHYKEARDLLKKEVNLHPEDVTVRVYLATAELSLWIPGVNTPENEENARMAEAEFKRVLELNPINKTAMQSLASMAFNAASGLTNEERARKFNEARDWYLRIINTDPASKESYYNLAIIPWRELQEALMRISVDPGPFPSPAREELSARYLSTIEESIANLGRALRLDPQYSDAMRYMNLMIRMRADLRETKEEYFADISAADAWAQKASAAMNVPAGRSLASIPEGYPRSPVVVVDPVHTGRAGVPSAR